MKQPHDLIRIRPAPSSNSAGESVLSYQTDDGAVRTPFKGFFQNRQSRSITAEEGLTFGQNSFCYTDVQDFLDNDMLIVAVPGTTGNFKVMGVEAKYRERDGKFTHNRLTLVRDQATVIS